MQFSVNSAVHFMLVFQSLHFSFLSLAVSSFLVLQMVLNKEHFDPPPDGWQWEADWFINPELR